MINENFLSFEKFELYVYLGEISHGVVIILFKPNSNLGDIYQGISYHGIS